MTKAGPLKAALRVIDKDLDEQIEDGKKHGATALEAALLDKVLRPYVKMMEMQRVASGDAEEWVDATFWLMAVLTVECALNTTDKHQPDQVYGQINRKMKDYAESVSSMLAASIPVSKPH